MADHGLHVGTPELTTVGAIAFGPDDILFVADTARAAIVAVDVADPGGDAPTDAFELDDLGARLAEIGRAHV